MAKRKTHKMMSNQRPIVFTFCLLFAFLGILFFYKQQYPLGVFKYDVRGVDVSKHSGVIDWKRIKEQGVDFVIIKATEGENYIDPLYDDNYRNAIRQDLIVGTYHFFRFNKDGEKQALHYLKYAKIKSGNLMPAIDVEFFGNEKSNKSDDEIVKEIKSFVNLIVSRTGVCPIIYTNREAYNRLIKNNFPDQFLWYCDLNQDPDNENVKCQFWQYSHKGKLEGAPHLIDLNVYKGSIYELSKCCVVE